MSAPVKPRAADDPLCDVYGCVTTDGWDCGPPESVQDASGVTRGQAINRYAREMGARFTDVRATVGYILIYTRQDAWAEYGWKRAGDTLPDRLGLTLTGGHGGAASKWVRECDGKEFTGAELDAMVPRTVPDSFAADNEEDPAWELVSKEHPRAIRVWICEEKPA